VQNPHSKVPSIHSGWFLGLAFIVGLVYLFLLPPWQQNDEPGQFEYVWLAANLDHWPKKGEYDVGLRRQILTSMHEYRFFEDRGITPNLIDLSQPPDIGVPQVGSPPLYYFLASLPLRLINNTDIIFQFYVARFVSLLLFVATVFFSYRTSKILFDAHPLSLMLPALIALFPQLAYRMTAINDDSAAVASMTFLIWMSVRGIRNGADWKTLLGIPIGIASCVFSKTTAWLGVPIGLVALLLSIFRNYQKWVWIGLGGVSLLSLILMIDWNTTIPAYYYRRNGEVKHERSNLAVEGNYVFVTDKGNLSFYQVIDKNELLKKSSNGETTFTFGVWVWANSQTEIPFAKIEVDGVNRLELQNITVSETPTFYTSRLTVPEQFRSGVLQVNRGFINDEVSIYWDCFILVAGDFDLTSISTVTSKCEKIQLGSNQTENLIRNPSAEIKWFPMRKAISSILSESFKLSSADFWAVTDPPTSFLYFRDAAMYLYRTFWGRFNWGTLPLVGNKPYRIFIIPTLLAIVGNGLGLMRYRKMVNWSFVLLLLVILWGQLIYTLFRFAGDWHTYYLLLPQARYFFPAVFAAGFFLCTGWYIVLDRLFTPLGINKSWVLVCFAGLLILYNFWAWLTIWNYWY